jgi:hypothetical protein
MSRVYPFSNARIWLQMPNYPAVDSNTLTYLLDAVSTNGYDPALDTSGLVDERLAMVWCFFYGNCSPWVPPTAQREYERIRSSEKRERHRRWTIGLLQDAPLRTPEEDIQRRAAELLQYHNKAADCRIVTETEFAGLDVLLSCDHQLRRLQPYTRARILKPTEFWQSLGITEEPDSVIMPAPGNPLRDKSWWRKKWPIPTR